MMPFHKLFIISDHLVWHSPFIFLCHIVTNPMVIVLIVIEPSASAVPPQEHFVTGGTG